MRYTIREFHKQFKSDKECLAYIYQQRYPKGATCPKCRKKGHFYPVEKRRAYACECGHQIYPTAGTIFHKSPTSLKSWFFAMFLMTASKNGVSAKELERHLGVTYKCAWRMAHQIRQLLKEPGLSLKGTVEADETFIGGKSKGTGSGNHDKTPVMGMVERKGSVVAKVIPNTTAQTLLPNLSEHVMPQSLVITDEWKGYRRVRHQDFIHETV